MQELSHEAFQQLVAEGDMPETIRTASERVAVILTQSWCPDWFVMRHYLESMDEPGLTIFYLEYDRQSFFREAMAFKEGVFGNYQIPYVRYYRDGEFVAESNRVFRPKKFLEKFDS